MKRTFLVQALALALLLDLALPSRADETADAPDPLVKPGETVLLVGDAFATEIFDAPTFYPALTNAVKDVRFLTGGGGALAPATNKAASVVVLFRGMDDLIEPTLRDDAAEIGRWLLDYANRARGLKERLQPREMIFATLTPVTGDLAAPANRVRDRLNNRLRMLAAMTGARIVDFGAAVEDAVAATKGVDANYRLLTDGVRPNALGQLVLAETLCAGLGLKDAAETLAEAASAIENDLAEANDSSISAWATIDPLARPTDGEFVYDLSYSLAGDTEIDPEVRVVAPAGWTVDAPLKIGAEGAFRLRGNPTDLVTPVTVEAAVPLWSDCADRPTGIRTLRTRVDIPAPWKLREEGGPWRVYAASLDGAGGNAPGAIDPRQLYFGPTTNALHVARRVWSEKERDVRTPDLLHLTAGWNALEIVRPANVARRPFTFELTPLGDDDLSHLKYDLK